MPPSVTHWKYPIALPFLPPNFLPQFPYAPSCQAAKKAPDLLSPLSSLFRRRLSGWLAGSPLDIEPEGPRGMGLKGRKSTILSLKSIKVRGEEMECSGAMGLG